MKAFINNIRVLDLPYEHINKLIIEIPIREGTDFVNSEEKINKGGYVIEIKKPRKSKNMNSYMWVLCDKLGEKIGFTKEEIYKTAVKDAGKWFDLKVASEDYPSMESSWKRNGIGWFSETMFTWYDSEEDMEMTEARCYIGSSAYDHNELRKLTNYIVMECQNFGVETMTPQELDYLEHLWEVE